MHPVSGGHPLRLVYLLTACLVPVRFPQAAGVIHTDFEKGFIRAETVGYDDMVRTGTLAGAKEAGVLRSEGKEYVVHDGDIMNFRFSP